RCRCGFRCRAWATRARFTSCRSSCAKRASPISKPEHGIVIARDVMVPMRDGVRLASDIYWPADNGAILPGPFATILLRTSYDKMAPRYVDGIASYFTPR